MAKLYILCGPSSSGKSTWAQNNKNIPEDHYEYVSRDKIRYSMLKEGEDYFAHEKEVFKEFVKTIATCLKNSGVVVADATHLNEFSRRKLTQALDTYITEYKIVYVVFNTNLETCLKRNATREGLARVPEQAILRMFRDFKHPDWDEDERIVEILDYE